MLEIYLENEKLEIDETFSMSISYVYSHLQKPATLTGDASKSITVKGTPHNNRVLGQIWRFDRAIYEDGSNAKNVRIYFNPSKRTPCVITINGELFDRGYVRLKQITTTRGGDIEYSITFFSDMVDVLRRICAAKLRDLPFANDLRHTLNAAEVLSRYYSDSDGLRYIMASNGLYDDFESDKWLTKSGSTEEVVDVYNGIKLDETAIRQYRSYYQRPALMIKCIIDLIAQEYGIELDPAFFNDSNPYYASSVLALPQYKVTEQLATEIGQSWFGELPTEEVPTDGTQTENIPYPFLNPTNTSLIVPYFRNLSGGGATPVFAADWDDRLNLSALGKNKAQISLEFEYRLVVHTKQEIPYHITNDGLDWYYQKAMFSAPFTPVPQPVMYGAGEDVYFLPTVDAKKLSMQFLREGGNPTKTLVSSYRTPSNVYRQSIKDGYNAEKHWMQLKANSATIVEPLDVTNARIRFQLLNVEQDAPQTQFSFPKQITAVYRFADPNDYSLTRSFDVDYYEFQIRPITEPPKGAGQNNLNDYYPASDGFTGKAITLDESYVLRSGAIVDKRDMLDDELTQGDFLVNYMKLFGLIFYTEPDGTPHIVTRNTLFKDAKVHDWTDKVDYSQNIETQPVPFTMRYLSMKYAEGETYYETLYLKNNGLEFGEQRINTGYEFNDKVEDMIKDIPFQNTVMSKERTRMLIGADYIVQNDEKVLPAMFKKESGERNGSETKYNLLFYNGAKDLEDNTTQPYTVTDDDKKMLTADGGGKYCWVDVDKMPNPATLQPYVKQYTYPQYSTVYKGGRFSWHIGYPTENYAGYTQQTFAPDSTIFANFWQKYLSEIYNADNRIMTAYVYLTPQEVKNWSFGDFVYIDGVIWHPNKFIDFNPTNDKPTRVEMIRLSSNAAIAEAYQNGQTDMSAPEPSGDGEGDFE